MTGHAQLKLTRTAGFSLDVAFDIPEDAVTALFGPSGCGKTTVLRCIAGLEKARGRVVVAGRVWQDDAAGIFVPTYARRLGYVFQEASLFDHLNVRQNLEYGMKRIRDADAAERLAHAVELLGIGHLLDRRTNELSGGERQRCAIARSLAVKPTILLMDEPLASLDNARRREILPWLEKLRKELSIPILYVTHSEEEVERLADRVVMLSQGRKTAEGPVKDVFASRRTVGTLSAVVVEVDPDSSRMKIRLPEMGEKEIWIAATGAKPGDVLSLDLSAAGG